MRLHWPVVLAVVGFLMLTLPALMDTDHQLKNLEPYPDGLLYTLSARSLSQGQPLALHFEDSTLPLRVPPVYSLYLTPFFLVWNAPSVFYVANVVLGVISLVVLYKILQHFQLSQFTATASLLLYLSHGWIFWLPALPMSENIVLPLLLMGIYGLLKRQERWGIAISALGFVGLLFTRYSVVLTTLTGLLLISAYLAKKANTFTRIVFGGVSLALVAVLYVYLKTQGMDLWLMIINTFNAIWTGNQFWGFNNLAANFAFYTQSLLGQSQRWLWWTIPFTSAAVVLSTIYGLWSYRNKFTAEVLGLCLLGLSVYPLLFVFYYPDLRYSFLIFPVLLIGTGFTLQTVWNRKKVIGMLLALTLLLSQIPQLTVLKTLVSANIFHTSTAWQYRAIQEFNTFAPTQDGEVLLITALPPHLVEAYQTTKYRVLPLSHSQEFMQKKQYIWGSDINYANLAETYQEWIAEGKTVYISNAYITHLQEVIADYEEYKEVFSFELVHEGCDQACNIYRLIVKNEQS